VGNARNCIVSFVDSSVIRHSIEVAAESLYEAAALAVREFRCHAWVDDVEPEAVTPLSVSVKPPATTHEVSIRQLEKWTAFDQAQAALAARELPARLDRSRAAGHSKLQECECLGSAFPGGWARDRGRYVFSHDMMR
jgi:hypothetical protein